MALCDGIERSSHEILCEIHTYGGGCRRRCGLTRGCVHRSHGNDVGDHLDLIVRELGEGEAERGVGLVVIEAELPALAISITVQRGSQSGMRRNTPELLRCLRGQGSQRANTGRSARCAALPRNHCTYRSDFSGIGNSLSSLIRVSYDPGRSASRCGFHSGAKWREVERMRAGL